MSTLRLKRLAADHDRLREFCERHPRLKLLAADGDPPETYQVEYKIKSLRRVDDRLDPVGLHVVEISLPRDYPRAPPRCRMLTPVFHPNIAPHAICVGDHWSAGEPISSIVARIGEILAYQSYNTRSPLNGEAARWVDEHIDQLPLDKVSMLIDVPGRAPVAPTPTPAAPRERAGVAPAPRPAEPAAERVVQRPAAPPLAAPAPVEPPQIAFRCPQCGSLYRVAVELAGKRVRCKKCQGVMSVPGTAEAS